MKEQICVAIDGYSACGKSTTAKLVAQRLKYTYIDTGAMYRAVTYYFMLNHVNIEESEEVKSALKNIQLSFEPVSETKREIFLNGVNVEKDIRTMEVAQRVSPVSAIKAVRDFLVDIQKQMAEVGGIVMEGRDIGTNVLPKAEVKIFCTADMEVRAIRRQAELLGKGQRYTIEEIEDNIKERDRIDTTRKDNPLKKAHDAIEMDTTRCTIDQQVKFVLDQVKLFQDSF